MTLRDSDFQKELWKENSMILVTTKKAWANCGRTLCCNNSYFKKSRKRNETQDVIFTYIKDTIQYSELMGNENIILLDKINNKHFKVQLNN